MKPPRLYAEGTSVPVDRSKAEIGKLLREWSCSSIGWVDHYAEGNTTLEFTWERDTNPAAPADGKVEHYRVRMTIHVRSRVELEAEAKRLWPETYNRNHQRARSAFISRGLQTGAQQAHRLLLLKLKADLNAAAAGIARAEEIFLPWMVDHRGRTVADVVLPKLHELAALPPGSPPPPDDDRGGP